MQNAEECKKRGNDFFGLGQWNDALGCYEAAMGHIRDLPAPTAESRTLLVICLSNSSQACLSKRDYDAAIAFAECALDIDPSHEKSQSRRSIAREKKQARDAMLAEISYGGDSLDKGDAEDKADRRIVLSAVSQYGCALRFADEALRKDREIVLAAVTQSGDALRYADAVFLSDRDVVLAAVSSDGRALSFADPIFRTDRGVVLAAVSQDGCCLSFASDELRGDRDVVLAAVRQDGYALIHADLGGYSADTEVVLAAVAQTGHALRYAHPTLRADREVVLVAVRQDPQAMLYADPSLRSDAEKMTHTITVRHGLATIMFPNVAAGVTFTDLAPAMSIDPTTALLRSGTTSPIPWGTQVGGPLSVVVYSVPVQRGPTTARTVCSAAVLGVATSCPQPCYVSIPTGRSLCGSCAVTCHGLQDVGMLVDYHASVFACECRATGRCCWSANTTGPMEGGAAPRLLRHLGSRVRKDKRSVAWASAHTRRESEGEEDPTHRREAEELFRQRVTSSLRHTMQYYRSEAQTAARALIPLETIRERAGGDAATDEKVLRELLQWFKHEFFKWVGSLNCERCGKGTGNAGGLKPSGEELRLGAGMVEAHRCGECQHITRFPRYNCPVKLLETRRGRCGEWANCFTLCAIAMGFEARHVVDHTDHVWTECWVPSFGRWVHMDPCENRFDGPLMYEGGWGKKLTYVMAYSDQGVVDVTRRYTKKFAELKRGEVTEEALVRILESVNRTPLRSRVDVARAAMEAVELASGVPPERPVGTEGREGEGGRGQELHADEGRGQEGGRTTGSWEWRAARGELGGDPKK